MRIGLFTDTYFPQVSGVATSIRTLKTQLEKMGHTVFIFTTTDKDVDRYEDWQIVRIPSVPFFAFKDRRVAYRGFSKALEIAKQYKLDIIHTQTEFSLGLLGIAIARELKIPVVHTYHTQYEDYVRYIAKGMVIRPSMVKYIVRGFMSDLDGVICPSEISDEIQSQIDEIVKKGFDPHIFIAGLGSHFRDLMLAQNPSTLALIEIGENTKAKYAEQSQKWTAQQLINAIEICNHADINYKNSKNPRLTVEIALMQLASLTAVDLDKKKSS